MPQDFHNFIKNLGQKIEEARQAQNEQEEAPPPQEGRVAKDWTIHYAFSEVYDARKVAFTLFEALDEAMESVREAPEGMGVCIQISDGESGSNYTLIPMPDEVIREAIGNDNSSPVEGAHVLFLPRNEVADSTRMALAGKKFLEELAARAKTGRISLDNAPWNEHSGYKRIDSDPDWGGEPTIALTVKILASTEKSMKPAMDELNLSAQEVIQYVVAAFMAGGHLGSQRTPEGQRVITLAVPPFAAVLLHDQPRRPKKPTGPLFMGNISNIGGVEE